LKSAGNLVRTFGHQLTSEGLVYLRRYSSATHDYLCLASHKGWDEIYQVPGGASAFQVSEKYVVLGLESGNLGVFQRSQSLTVGDWQTKGVESSFFQGINFRSAQIRLGKLFATLGCHFDSDLGKIEAIKVMGSKIYALDCYLRLLVTTMSIDDRGRMTLNDQVVTRIEGLDSAILPRCELRLPLIYNDSNSVVAFNDKLYSLKWTETKAELLLKADSGIECTACLAWETEGLAFWGQSGGRILVSHKGSTTAVPLIEEKIPSKIMAIIPLLDEFTAETVIGSQGLSALAILEEEAKVHIFELLGDGTFQIKSSIRVLEHLRATLGSSETDLDAQSIRLLCHR
jgi:hypothetical protein